MTRRIALLGSTGSIGTQTLAVIEDLHRAGHRFSVIALAAGKNLELLAAQVQRFQPKLVVIEQTRDLNRLGRLLRPYWSGELLAGGEGLHAAVTHPDVDLVVNALVGAAGLIPTLEALRANKIVALANKESLVIGGHLIKSSRVSIIPIDSEHSALFQLVRSLRPSEIERVILTASGGPFRTRPLDSFAQITIDEALQHPTWRMGKRITIDSATLVNKAFEVIEAHWLFDLPYEKISVLIHPQSAIHGLVELTDGSLLAHLSTTDMKLPIQYALTYPERVPSSVERLDLVKQRLEFAPVGRERYPAFWTVLEAGRRGGTYPAVANAADEVLVQRFLNNEIAFTQIAQGLETILAEHQPVQNPSLEEIWEADRWARERAGKLSPNRVR
ncbi:MAG: 1-deoxy-D-xylulose-5-phosphate reductoisomerase [Candidatus Bipolaricaulota bacterium]|nr:1-deoxy-D-xylulose-5-phosphate reductoisomerase [Candidatus Bipolaricaulota bacterium]MCS7273954.1 1-deoxy-D-xylulose-5-phosphate reductoisomerase [Candidatus Bipolaricaulota bacterium]